MELNISNKVKKLDLNSIKKQESITKDEIITNNVKLCNKGSFGEYIN